MAEAISNAAKLPTHGLMRSILDRCRELQPVPTAIAHPCDAVVLRAALEAQSRGLIEPILVGPKAKIHAAADAAGLSLGSCQIHDAAHSHDAARIAVGLVRSGEAAVLMKGSLHTEEFLRAAMAVDGLRTDRRMSHVYVMDVPLYAKPLLVTDAAVNITPSLADKRDIAQNAIDLAHILGIAEPRVAVLAPVELVEPHLQTTVDAAALAKMADRGQITGGWVDGPLALDNAVSPDAANEKGIRSSVAGQADILLVPDLVTGNVLAKQLTFLAGADAAAVVVGAAAPIVLTSRADSIDVHVASCAVAVLMVQAAQAARQRAA